MYFLCFVSHRAKSWIFTQDSPCLPNMEPSANCTYIFAICNTLDLLATSPCNGGSVCQMDDVSGSQQAKQYELAGFNETVMPLTTFQGSKIF